jgi:citronellyl-CoA dehydrogenase
MPMAVQERWFTEEHEMFRQSLRRFIETEMAPHADEWEAAEYFPDDVFRKMGELGFLGARYPEELGGMGGDIWHTVVLCEELPRCRSAGTAMGIMVQTDMATPIIGEIGTPEQIEEFLKPAIRGEKIAALGVSEPGAGSDVAGIRTTAKRVGDEYVINGAKTYITNGLRADFITLAARTDPDNRYGGISLFTFPTDVAGFQVSKKLKKLGNLASDTAELFFEDCRIPARYVLGEVGHGFYYIMTNFQGERLVAAVSACAGAQLLLDATIAYCKERKAFGKPLTGFQVTRHKLADMQIQIEAGRRLTYHACDRFAQVGSQAVKEVTMAKAYTAEMAKRVTDECLQLHGGMGYMEEMYVSRAYRDTRLLAIGGGTTEIMKEILTKLMNLP